MDDLPSSHGEAAKTKSTWYFTGKPCKRGHIDKRFTTNGVCYSCSKEKISIWRNNNIKILREQETKRWNKNKKSRQQAYKNWCVKNKSLLASKSNEYRCRKLSAMPAWVDKNELLIFYKQAKELTDQTGTKYHVDHIVPLKGRNVCGLHVPWNLQVITASENSKKKNNF